MPETFFSSYTNIGDLLMGKPDDKYKIHEWLRKDVAKHFIKVFNQGELKLKDPDLAKLMMSTNKLRVNQSSKQFGKIISISDFLDAALFLQTNTADFHNERLHTLMVYDEQEKPSKFENEGYLVLSKIDIPKDKQQVNFMDFHDRQVFHKFELITKPQIQAMVPAGVKYDYHRFRVQTSDAMAAVSTLEEVNFYNENASKITRQKQKSLQKDEYKVCNSETEGQLFQHIEPMPNMAHAHCGICKISYTDYYEHISSKEHISNSKSQHRFFKMIDDIFGEREKESRWQTTPLIKEIKTPRKQLQAVTSQVQLSQQNISNEQNNDELKEQPMQVEEIQPILPQETSSHLLFQDQKQQSQQVINHSQIVEEEQQEHQPSNYLMDEEKQQEEVLQQVEEEQYNEEDQQLLQTLREDDLFSNRSYSQERSMNQAEQSLRLDENPVTSQTHFEIKNLPLQEENCYQEQQICSQSLHEALSMVNKKPSNLRENLSTINEVTEGKSHSQINNQSVYHNQSNNTQCKEEKADYTNQMDMLSQNVTQNMAQEQVQEQKEQIIQEQHIYEEEEELDEFFIQNINDCIDEKSEISQQNQSKIEEQVPSQNGNQQNQNNQEFQGFDGYYDSQQYNCGILMDPDYSRTNLITQLQMNGMSQTPLTQQQQNLASQDQISQVHPFNENLQQYSNEFMPPTESNFQNTVVAQQRFIFSSNKRIEMESSNQQQSLLDKKSRQSSFQSQVKVENQTPPTIEIKQEPIQEKQVKSNQQVNTQQSQSIVKQESQITAVPKYRSFTKVKEMKEQSVKIESVPQSQQTQMKKEPVQTSNNNIKDLFNLNKLKPQRSINHHLIQQKQQKAAVFTHNKSTGISSNLTKRRMDLSQDQQSKYDNLQVSGSKRQKTSSQYGNQDYRTQSQSYTKRSQNLLNGSNTQSVTQSTKGTTYMM
eukprot:403366989